MQTEKGGHLRPGPEVRHLAIAAFWFAYSPPMAFPSNLTDHDEAVDLWNRSNSALWKDWNNGFRLEDAVARIPSGTSGAYLLGLMDERRKSIPITRLCGEDPHGVLDIGESDDLKDRLGKLSTCLTKEGARGHMAGWRYTFLRLKELLPGDLYVCWCSAEDSYELEGKMLWAYTSAFRELPPLNYKFNWSRVTR